MFTGASLRETLETNIFVFFSILDSSDAVIAEEALRNIKISDNKLLAKSEKTFDRYGDLAKHFKEVLREKGIKTWNTDIDTAEVDRFMSKYGGVQK